MKEAPEFRDERAGPCRPGPGRHAPALLGKSVTRTVFPLAYHITFGTYGTRLHGDERGTVDRSLNKFGDPIIGREGDWNRMERRLLRFEPRKLTIEQRVFAEKSVPQICTRGKWQFIEVAAAPDHVHNMIVANADGNAVRKWLKRWLSEALSDRWPLQQQEVWWAECDSVKWIWTQDYFEQVKQYVGRQRTSK